MTFDRLDIAGTTRSRRRPWNVPSNLLAAGATALVLFVTARGIAGGYVAMKDRAIIALRARDVLTAHHPLVGVGSSGSTEAIPFNHRVPLLLDVLAVPVRLLGDSNGIATGAAIVNIVAVWASC